MGCCLLYAMSGFSTKSVQAAASLQKEDGQLVGGKAQDISPAGKYKPKENEDAKNTEVKDQEEQKSTGTNDLTQNATGASAQSGTYGNVKWKLSGTTLTITGSGACQKKNDNRLSDRDCTDGIFRNLSNRRRDDTA